MDIRPQQLMLGPQVCGSLAEASAREWLVTDGAGGFAMGTVAGLRTRRYHGLLVVATEPPIGRRLGLAALDPVLVIDGERHELATHRWASGATAPAGHRYLTSFALLDGVPRWRWSAGGVEVQAELAMAYGRPAVGVVYEVVSVAPGTDPEIDLELTALATWRDVHGERRGDADPAVEQRADGFVFEGAYRVRGPGFEPAGAWYRGVHHPEEAARGLNAEEDLWCAGRFRAGLAVGRPVTVEAWADDGASLDGDGPPPGTELVAAARERARLAARRAGAVDAADELLAHAADQLVVRTPSGPTVVAGYPWFGDWSRDTMTSYEGLFLCTGRWDEGAELLRAAAATVSAGMLANTADAGGTEYNTVDGTLWFLHALGRHIEVTGDDALGRDLWPTVAEIVDRHRGGTRFGIRADGDGLLTQGADGWALTWMDARIDGQPVTARRGKAVEVNALWIRGLAVAARLAAEAPLDPGSGEAPLDPDREIDAAAIGRLRACAVDSFRRRFVRPDGLGLYDVVDPDPLDPTAPPDAAIRPNQLLAVSLPDGPIDDPATVQAVLRAVRPLVTPLGLRSLAPDDPAYRPCHRGGPAERDAAYHQGTVWPWLIGPWVDAGRRVGRSPDPALDALVAHLGDWGLGSVSETADGAAPHGATGCPFQAWSVAELLRVRRS